MSAECIVCQNPVRACQQGLQCDGCFRWQHRTCGTGISQCDYCYAVQTGASIDWRCVTCQSMSLSESMPVAESTPVDFTESMFTFHEPLADPAESTPVTESTPIAESTTWSPSDWTVFKKAARTNNDIEGWHHGLNRRASGRGQLPLYLLIQLLHKEAKLTALQIRLVSDKKLKRIQRHKYRDLQTKLFDLWDEYEANTRSAKRLLKACSYLNAPRE